MPSHRSLHSGLLSTGITGLVCPEYSHRSEIWLGTPIYNGKTIIGAMVVQSYTNPEAYNEDSKYVIELAAHELSSYIGRKEAEQNALKLSKAIEQNPVSIVITDRDGIIDYVNPKFTEVTGYSLQEAIGMRPSILYNRKNEKYSFAKPNVRLFLTHNGFAKLFKFS